MNILSNGDLVGGYTEATQVSTTRLIKHNKDTGAITTFLSLGTFIFSLSTLDSNVLVGGRIALSSVTHKWAVLDSTNTPTLWCNATLPVAIYMLYESSLITVNEYVLLFHAR